MSRGMTLKAKLITYGVALSVIPILLVGVVMLIQMGKIRTVAVQETESLAFSDLDHIAQGVYTMCATQEEVLQQMVDHSLNVARRVMGDAGQVRFAPEEMVAWQAVNQYTKDASSISLPKMCVGEIWLGQISSMDKSAPVVDEVQDLVEGTCTIFQRMNPQGDMLRVCTNVEKLDGTRAIGTYIPKTNPDGEPNPVIETVLKGETFRGRAFVVNKWYITAYEPIFDDANKVVGVLYVGIPQESATALRQAIRDIEVGETGYVYILNATGHTRGYYVIASTEARDGQDIWEAADADGNLFIQEICEKALKLGPNEIDEQVYPWQNEGDPVARMKVARIMYFEPWDWVIGVGSYLEEFNNAGRYIEGISRTSNYAMLGLGGLTLVAAVLIWLFVAGGLTRRVNAVVADLTGASEEVNAASTQISRSSQSLAEGASEQASSLEETSASLEEM